MARQRILHPDFWTDERVVQACPLGRLLFQGLWGLADREGRLEDKPISIKMRVLPADSCNVDELLTDLATLGLIQRYEVDGSGYIAITNFLKYQKPHPRETASEFPEPVKGEPRFALGAPRLPVSKTVSETVSVSKTVREDLPLAPKRSRRPRPPKAPEETKPPDPRHAPLVQALVDAAPGYAFVGGRDALAVTALLGLGEPAEIVARWRRARARSGYPLVRQIHELPSNWNHFSTDSPGGRRDTQTVYVEGEAKL